MFRLELFIEKLKLNNNTNKLKTITVSAAADAKISNVIIKHFISKFIKPINKNNNTIPK